LNQWPMAAMLGVNRREQPKPVSTPNDRMKCHSSSVTRLDQETASGVHYPAAHTHVPACTRGEE
jgi:hypothetical protein